MTRDAILKRFSKQVVCVWIAMLGITVALGTGCASLTSTDPAERIRALEMISDHDVLAEVAEQDKVLSVRIAAAKRMTDQNMLTHFTLKGSEWEVRQVAFMKLNDASLKSLISKTHDPSLSLAVKIRLNLTTLDHAFSNTAISNRALGDAIGAAALIDNPNISPRTVVKACHLYIRQGDVARIPELRSLLMRYGDVRLAEDYLNCGQKDLAEAGRKWARANGYMIGAGFGSHRVRWGSGR